MGLELLVPIFLVGLAAIGVPVFLHLTRRQRRNVVLFPSLMFLRRIPFREQRRRRIRHWLLLLLRALALAAIVLAFTRPFVENAVVDGAVTGGPREVVVLLDRSYSMAAGNAFADAVDEARQVFGGLGPLDRASLVLFDRGAELAVRSTFDPAELERALDAAEVGSNATRYGPALRVAATVVEESRLPVGEIYLMSDLQQAGWSEDDESTLSAKARLIPVPVGAARELTDADEMPQLADYAVTDISLARSADAGRERVTVTARVARFGTVGESGSGETLPLTLSVDGDEVETANARLSDAAGSVSFRPFTLSQPYTRGEVALEGDDALSANDARRFVVSPGGHLAIRIAEGAGAEDGASQYLLGAFSVADERFRVSQRLTPSFGADELDDYDVVILNDARPSASSLVRLDEFVAGGGGLIVVAGSSSSWGSAWEPLPGVQTGLRDWESGRAGRLGLLSYSHPILEPFSGPHSGDFTAARFFRARTFRPTDSATALMSFDDGGPALVERGHGLGRVLLWTSSLDLYWNDLAVQPVYLPFVHRLVEHASGRSEAVVEFAVNQVLDLEDPVALESAGATPEEAAGLAGESGLIAIAPGGDVVEMQDPGDARFLVLAEAGFYAVRREGTAPGRTFSVAANVDVVESDLTPIDPEELAARLAGPSMDTDEAAEASDPGFETELRRADRERRQSLWRWLLLGALALFVAETVLSNRTPALARER